VIVILLVELLNSAIEAAVDRIGFEHHELSGRAKDIGSAAVMLSLAWAAITWGLLLL
jgi:diacylglycerol kinase (ATP)